MVRAARHPDESNRLITTRPPLERYEYTYDNASDIDKRLDKRTRNRTGPDEDYAYDGLNRLTEAVRGSDGSPFTAAGTRSQQWTYDALGNQVETITDTQAATGTFTSDTDLTYARVFNKVNEATSADTTESQGTPVTITQAYDDAGNHTADGDDAFTYDAWNRLVKVEVGGTPVDRAVYTYYPLHQRATRKADDDLSEDAGSPGSPRLETWTRYYYDASWRLLEERVHVADAYADDEWSEIPLAKIVQRIWGLTYIDEFCAMVTDTDSGSPDGDLTTGSPERLFALHDRKFDVTALYNPALGAGLRVVERVRYSAYGVARHMPSGDVNGDGAVDGTDLAVLLANWNKTYLNAGVVDTSFPADLDLNGDNTISGSDQAALLTRYASARPEGALSTKGNTVGYAGYLYDEAVDKYCVRFRWYDAEQGSWWTRDPVGYRDGSNIYEYVGSSPTTLTDPSGLGAICRRPLRRRAPLLDTPGLDYFNLEPEHEHIFYDDGGWPSNEGFFPNGVRSDYPNWTREHYSDCEDYPNDAALREAARRCKARKPYCRGGEGYDIIHRGDKGNCQTFTACVRDEYQKLTNRRKECIRWFWQSEPGGGMFRKCVEHRVTEDTWEPPCENEPDQESVAE